MAINPKKIKDPTDTALNAIQEVLSTTDQPGAGRADPVMDQPPLPPRENRRGNRSAAQTADKGLFEGPEADALRAPRAANDDRQSIGQILQTLQRRPPKTSYLVATLFALAWVIGGSVLAFLFLPDLRAVLSQGAASIPAMIGL